MSSAMAANPTSTELAVFDPSIFSFWSTRTALRLLKWLGWGALCFAAAAVVFIACVAAYVAVAEHRRRQAALARRKREQRARMMRQVRDAPYEEMLAARVVRNPCVVCRTEYEAGETCSFLPRCAHVFHKHCIAAWLLHHDTCPICNAAVLAPAS